MELGGPLPCFRGPQNHESYLMNFDTIGKAGTETEPHQILVATFLGRQDMLASGRAISVKAMGRKIPVRRKSQLISYE